MTAKPRSVRIPTVLRLRLENWSGGSRLNDSIIALRIVKRVTT